MNFSDGSHSYHSSRRSGSAFISLFQTPLLIDFSGASAYLEVLVPRMITPSIEKLILFFDQLTDSFKNVRQFTSTNENLRFSVAKVVFATKVVFVNMYPPEGLVHRKLYVQASCGRLSEKASFMVILSALSPILSAVEHVALIDEHALSPE